MCLTPRSSSMSLNWLIRASWGTTALSRAAFSSASIAASFSVSASFFSSILMHKTTNQSEDKWIKPKPAYSHQVWTFDMKTHKITKQMSLTSFTAQVWTVKKNACEYVILLFHLRELPWSAGRQSIFMQLPLKIKNWLLNLIRFRKNSHFRLLAMLGSSSGESSATAKSCSSLTSTVSQETNTEQKVWTLINKLLKVWHG